MKGHESSLNSVNSLHDGHLEGIKKKACTNSRCPLYRGVYFIQVSVKKESTILLKICIAQLKASKISSSYLLPIDSVSVSSFDNLPQ